MDLFDFAAQKTTAEELIDLLIAEDLTIATAESCTGGLIADAIVSVPGASEVFYEGIVSYSNSAKVNRLNVDKSTLREYGAVSAPTAAQMAEGLLSQSVDIAISTTGIAGPGGGTVDKPVGLVYIAVASLAGTEVEEFRFSGDRNSIRNQAKQEALYLALKYIKSLE